MNTLKKIHFGTSHKSEYSQAQKLYGLWEWSLSGECPDNFDNGFLRSLIDSFAQWDGLTSRQESALDNITSRFEVDDSWFDEIDDDYEPDI